MKRNKDDCPGHHLGEQIKFPESDCERKRFIRRVIEKDWVNLDLLAGKDKT